MRIHGSSENTTFHIFFVAEFQSKISISWQWGFHELKLLSLVLLQLMKIHVMPIPRIIFPFLITALIKLLLILCNSFLRTFLSRHCFDYPVFLHVSRNLILSWSDKKNQNIFTETKKKYSWHSCVPLNSVVLINPIYRWKEKRKKYLKEKEEKKSHTF